MSMLALSIVTSELCHNQSTWSTQTTRVFDSESSPSSVPCGVHTRHQSKMRSLKTSGAKRVHA